MSVGLLHFNRVGSGPPVVLMHGLFGMGGNLGALARALQDQFEVFSLDLPNHGRSPWGEGLGLPDLAETVGAWLAQQGLRQVALVGHSLGGKVAMQLALDTPERVNCVVAADIAPVYYPPRHREVFAALEAVEAAQCRSRAAAATLMQQHLEQQGVVQFLLMSLQRAPDGVYRWRFNLELIRRDYARLSAAPVGGEPYTGSVLFLKGGASEYILPQHRPAIEMLFPAAELKLMPGCGHWLHAEQPRLFNGIVSRFLERHGAAGAYRGA